MKEIKSAYEIAMEKANEISKDVSIDDQQLQIRDDLKPIMAKFYKGDIDSEGLWQQLKEKDEEIIKTAQIMIIESLGLRTSPEEFEKRKKGILALESLKEKSQASTIEQNMANIKKLKEKHKQEREKLEKQIERHMNNNSQVQMKPVKTEDGRTVMKMESNIDQETRERFNKAISELEAKSSKQFSWLIENMKQQINSF